MTIYYETARHGLIACQFIGWAPSPCHDVTGQYNVVIRLKRGGLTGSGYYRGDVLHVPRSFVVEKAGRRDYHQLVRSAALPQVTDSNLIPARKWPS